MVSQARQNKTISDTRTIALTRLMGCGLDICPFSTIVCRFRYIYRS
jgi:hypothetical protein